MEEIVEVRIDGLSVNAEGVGRLRDGRVVFVPRALPGDVARVRLGRMQKRVQHAELVELAAPSPDRVENVCRSQSCSACPLGALSREAQARAKQQRVLDTLWRIGGMDVGDLLGDVSFQRLGWHSRHRVRLHAAYSEGGWKLGLHEPKSRHVVEVEECAILWPELIDTVREVRRLVRDLPRDAALFEVEVAYSRRDGRGAAHFEASGTTVAFKRWVGDVLESALGGAVIETPAQTMRYGKVELRYDHARAADFDMRFEPGIFTQANPEMNDRLVAAVLEAVRAAAPRRLLELHAGIGNFSVPIRLLGIEVIATERARRATVLSRRNARTAGVELEVRDESDADAVRALGDFGAVLLDPPRSGAREAVEAIAAAPSVERVIYVSCDVATLARDAALLAQAGFRPLSVQAFDMFPNTPHVETLLVLGR